MLPDETILSIKSPKKDVHGPYAVIHKNDKELWAIVALGWGENKTPSLGIRWFPPSSENQGERGHPSSHGRPTWFIIPGPLHRTILAGLPLDVPTHAYVLRYLTGVISGEELQESVPST